MRVDCALYVAITPTSSGDVPSAPATVAAIVAATRASFGEYFEYDPGSTRSSPDVTSIHISGGSVVAGASAMSRSVD
eukprot:14882-Pelagococcus_subviridis.AAC.3